MKDIELIGGTHALGGPMPRVVHYQGRAYLLVGEGETLWQLASDLWGDGRRASELWAAQPGLYRALRANMNNVQAGDVLVLPQQGVGSMYGTGVLGRTMTLGAADVLVPLTDVPTTLQGAASDLVLYLASHPQPTGKVPVVLAFQQQFNAFGQLGQLKPSRGSPVGEDSLYGPDTQHALGLVLQAMGSQNQPAPAPSPNVGPSPAPAPAPGNLVVPNTVVTGEPGLSGWQWALIGGLGLLGVGGLGYAVHRAMK
jgi:hypothetical protein